ncbi:MAG: TonB-dependent receptor [Planctomycetota bacterium]
MRWRLGGHAVAVWLCICATTAAQERGLIRGVVTDEDFGNTVEGARVRILETEQSTTTGEAGNYLVSDIPVGSYTVVFSGEGYLKRVRTDVTVVAGRATELDMAIGSDFAEMDEFVVPAALQFAGGSEAALLNLRFEAPSLMDSIGAELLSRAGASDAAGAVRLIPGATVRDDSTPVIRGLPDRYVASLLNGVRLPSADEDTRAVQLDQFPSAVIESVQVTKTFTPDQQGDASGGAVDVRLKGLPDEPFFFRYRVQASHNTQVTGRNNFLSYRGGGVNADGRDGGRRGIQFENEGMPWTGAVGVSRQEAPVDYKWSLATGGRYDLSEGVRIGGYAAVFYERDSAFFDNGIDDRYWVEGPGLPATPQTSQGTVREGDFNTQLFDVTRGSQSVQLGGLATLGLETDNHALNLVYLYTRTTQDEATLAEDTRGKAYYFPGHDPENRSTPGHEDPFAAPYLRTESLEYTERTTQMVQFRGKHRLPIEEIGPFRQPEVDWSVAYSTAYSYQPDRRLFGSLWTPDGTHRVLRAAATFTLGNLQRIWKRIEEDSEQYSVSLKLPFEHWAEDAGYIKVGWFSDDVDRLFDQDTSSNFKPTPSTPDPTFTAPYEQFWSASLPFEEQPVSGALIDVDYTGNQTIESFYAMLDLPLLSTLKLIGGVRFESTDIGIVNDPEEEATWFPPGQAAEAELLPGEADVDFTSDDVLPSISAVFTPTSPLTVRASYNETVARQTFRELTPILQQEFLGGPIFIDNPDLQMAELKNYDLRLDYTPYDGGLFSASWFYKDIKGPIEFVQRVFTFDFTTPVNYPKGTLQGFEFETRHDIGNLWEPMAGLALGANATFIDSEVTLSQQEIDDLEMVQAPIRTRDATGAPERLYNIYITYDVPVVDTQVSLFYTITGDTLVTGAGIADINFVPSVYATQFDTLNFNLSQPLGDHTRLQFRARNLTNPSIQQVYRSGYIGHDIARSSFTRGIDFSLSVGGELRF